MKTPGLLDFRRLPRDELERMAAAGEEVANCVRVLAKTGDNIVGELLRNAQAFYEWDHYPSGDVYDPETHAQYYYHAHPSDERPGEHGHFHTFLRPKGMPPGVRPAPVPDAAPHEDPDDTLSHIVAICMDRYGVPVKLFTTNRWVTGETWYAASDVCRMIERFDIDVAPPSWPVNRWISGMVQLFRPQIVELVQARDRRLAAWQRQYPDRDAYEDRELEVAAEVDISVETQVAAVRRALVR